MGAKELLNNDYLSPYFFVYKDPQVQIPGFGVLVPGNFIIVSTWYSV